MKRAAAAVDDALAAGVTADELLNAANWARARDGGAASADEYVAALSRGGIAARPLRDEDDWDTPATKTAALGEIFHDYYTEIRPKGGAYTSATARINLRAAVARYGLQAIMSETLMDTVADILEKGDTMTCYQYIEHLAGTEDGDRVDTSLSEEQAHRRESEIVSLEQMDAAATDDDAMPAAAAPEETAQQTADAEEEAPEGPAMHTEGRQESDDWSFYDDDQEPVQGGYMTMPSPTEYKRAQIADALKVLQLDEFMALARCFDSGKSVDEMITDLADGKLRRDREDAEAREAHQILNGLLYSPFMECVTWQGVELSEAGAARLDLLLEGWDLRDARTRRLQKLKSLIYSSAMENAEDTELMAAVDDLEKYYGSCD